ncbi:MAG TPA: tetratricopeptide repeat protein, partial [Candidatus Binatia bacterium]|nr:tetratricopeptide repeat protein [Candidatus Binatia bacterium]
SNPADYQNSYGLARAYYETRDYDPSKQIVITLMPAHNTAELHHLLGDLEEKLRDPLEAVRQYQRAAEMDPSEHYLFDWAAELLLHNAAEPARDVFLQGTHSFLRSERMLLGLGAAWFALGNDDNAIQQISHASDLDPSDPAPYLFLGKMLRAEKVPSDAAAETLHRFVTLQPSNPQANYYYAVALWKRRNLSPGGSSLSQVETLLNTAARLNPQYAPPHLQLGILHADAGNYSAAISDYERAIQLDSQSEEAHYRLAQAYRQLGQTDKSKEQLQRYQQLSQQSAQQADQERHEMRQFVYTLRDDPHH